MCYAMRKLELFIGVAEEVVNILKEVFKALAALSGFSIQLNGQPAAVLLHFVTIVVV